MQGRIILASLMLFGHVAHATPPMAQYPSPAPNHNVCTELIDDRDRMIYRNDWFCGAVDGTVFLRSLGPEEFYHGFSYWMQGRTQFDPSDYFRINVRSILYSGSVSYGYALPTNFYNVIGFSGKWPSTIFGGELRTRIMDLERQTIGAGTFIEDFDSAGMRLDWSTERWNIKLMGEGTGGLLLRDDTINFEIAYGPNLPWLGVGQVWWTEGGDGIKRKPLSYAYSVVDWADWFRSKLEVSTRKERYAYLIKFQTQFQTDNWNFESAAQGRYYESMVGEDFVGLIQHMYTSYDQLDKNFTNAKNIFTVADDVVVYALNLNITYEPFDKWRIFTLNEVGRFEYRAFHHTKYWYAKAGITYLPGEKRQDSLTFFYSNKVLMDSLALPPRIISSANVPFFNAIHYGGIEANFRF